MRNKIQLCATLVGWIMLNAATSVAYAPSDLTLQPPKTVVKDTFFSVQAAVNVGLLALDLQVKHFYSFVAGSIGLPIISEGKLIAFAAGAGYTLPISTPSESMWFVDFLGIANPTKFHWFNQAQERGNGWGAGLGVAVGVRYLHRSGFSLGFKLPLLGGYIGSGVQSPASSVGAFFVCNVLALPMVSAGYRF